MTKKMKYVNISWIALFVALCILMSYKLYERNFCLGDMPSIISYIKENSLINNEVHIIDVIDIGESRFVGFLGENGDLGVATLDKKKTKWIGTGICVKNNTDTAEFYYPRLSGSENSQALYIVLSKEENIEKLQLLINGSIYDEKQRNPNTITMTIFELNSLPKEFTIEINAY